MFARRVTVEYKGADGALKACPLAWIDNFSMQEFTGDAAFEDTLAVCDGEMEIGHRVPPEHLEIALEEWFRSKGYLSATDRVMVREMHAVA